MAISRRHMTADDLWRLPDDGLRHELIAGELRTMSPAGPRHGRIAVRFSTPLDQYVTEHDLGEVYAAETGFILARNPDTVQAPDVAFVRQARLDEIGEVEEGYFPGPPDLAVEVISPTDRPKQIRERVAAWLAADCRMVIAVDPRRRIVTIHRPGRPPRRLTEADTIDGEDVVPGWSLPVAALFARTKQ